jgi:hypothetical protein
MPLSPLVIVLPKAAKMGNSVTRQDKPSLGMCRHSYALPFGLNKIAVGVDRPTRARSFA